MLIEQRLTVPAALDRTWAFLLDIPSVARCVPGLADVTQMGDNRYAGVLSVRVGPIQLRLQGEVELTQADAETHTARMRLDASDKRVGGAVSAETTLTVRQGDGQTALAIETDARVLGKLGEFGQPVIRKKADQLVQEFARNLAEALRGS
jgi:carbon monoxide dehydrogenase subunit G